MKKIIIYMLLFLLINISVLALPAGKDYEVTTIGLCYDNVSVKIRGTDGTTGYSFDDCSIYKTDDVDEYWNCDCINNSLTLMLKTNASITKSYDVAIQYYVNKSHIQQYERIENFNNLEFGKQAKPKEPVEWPEFDNGMLITGLIIGVIIIVILLMVIAIRWVWNDEENIIGPGTKREEEVEHYDEDDDIIEKYSSK